MITSLDHVALAVRDLDRAAEAYRQFLGCDWTEREPERIRFPLANTALVLTATRTGDGLLALAFATDDLADAHRRMSRRGLPPGKLQAGGFAIDTQATGGIPIRIVASAPREAAGAPTGLDHVVVRTSNVDRALAIYGAKLGLDLRLDRSNADWGARQLFFKCAGVVVEIGAPLDAVPSTAADSFGGLAWRVDDAEAVQARLAAAGLDVSEVRAGRKPGSHVFTLRSGLPCAPALVIQQGEPL